MKGNKLARMNIDRRMLDHPEHFDDEIREFKASDRYVPTALEQLLFELANHRCTVCRAPWLEVHHIDELSEGGLTAYENLIVLCPNCHTRVHRENVPSKTELRHYKLKQEIAYELPVLSRLTSDERNLLAKAANLSFEKQVVFSESHCREVEAETQGEAVAIYRHEVGLYQLQVSGIVSIEQGFTCTMSDGKKVSVQLFVRFTGKGIKWLSYLHETNRVPALNL